MLLSLLATPLSGEDFPIFALEFCKVCASSDLGIVFPTLCTLLLSWHPTSSDLCALFFLLIQVAVFFILGSTKGSLHILVQSPGFFFRNHVPYLFWVLSTIIVSFHFDLQKAEEGAECFKLISPMSFQ